MQRPLLALAVLAVLAGCVAAPAAELDAAGAAGALRVVDAAGAPVPHAAVTLFAGEAVVARVSSGLDGTVPATVAFTRAVVAATGFAPATATGPGDVVLEAAAGPIDPLDPTPVLRLLPPYDFGAEPMGPSQCVPQRTTNMCGLSEPVIEVAGDGSIYVSSTCCVGPSPPVWVSRDGGATWDTLDTPGIREAVGIEGDFAIDDAGNVYFTDILLGAMWMTAWDASGEWLHSTPVPFKPLVDRPWVRAGADGVVYFLYNTGSTTNFHVSTDHGRTFSPIPLHEFRSALGTIAQGPERDHLWVVNAMMLYESTDGGASWSAGEEVPRPANASDDAGSWGFAVPVVDEAGRVLVAYDHGTTEDGYAIHAAVRDPDGTWRVERVTAPGAHHMPWPAAGPDGGFALAWYGSDDEATDPNSVQPDTRWWIHVATTHDGGRTWQTALADPEPIAEGPMMRRLLDFVQIDVAPDGAAHLVYATNRDGTDAERTLYARTTVGAGLAPLVFPHGPKAAAASEPDAALPASRLL